MEDGMVEDERTNAPYKRPLRCIHTLSSSPHLSYLILPLFCLPFGLGLGAVAAASCPFPKAAGGIASNVPPASNWGRGFCCGNSL